MNKQQTLGIVASITVVVLALAAAGGMEHQSYAGSMELERMKTLAGAWEGTGPMAVTGQPVRVEYRVTGAGSAVVETLCPGTPNEMVTVYYDQKGRLGMTHYCALGNRPHMVLKKSTPDAIDLELAPGGEVDGAKETHMHALKITFDGPDKITHEWTLFEDGHKKDASTFTFTRVK